MLNKFQERIYHDFVDFENRKIYLAVSGGKDSMALSHLLINSDIQHELLHCNFELRGTESDGDQQFIEDYAQSNNIPLHLHRTNAYNYADKHGLSIQEAAREIRYKWFEKFNAQNALILTAHHLDDSIETFFINLLRGTGIKGINGIPSYRHPYYRPLLHFSSDEILKYIDKHSIEYREDSSNRDSKYLRNELRMNLIPQFVDLDQQFKFKMKSFFDEIQSINDLLKQLKKEMISNAQKSDNVFDLKTLRTYDAIVIQYSLRDFGIKRSNIEEFIKFTESKTGSKFLTNSHEFILNRLELIVHPNERKIEFQETLIEKLPFDVSNDQFQINLSLAENNDFTKSKNPLFVDFRKIKMPCKIRFWKHGDKIKPLGMNGTKLISDILIDHKFSLKDKMNILVIEDCSNQIVAIPSLLISENFKVDGNSIQLLKIYSSFK